MRSRLGVAFVAALSGCLIVFSSSSAFTQPPGGKGKDGKGGFNPFGGQKRKLVKEYDRNGDGWLNKEEREAARDAVKKGGGFGPGGFGPKGGFGKGADMPIAKAGPKVTEADVKNFPNTSLYDTSVLRTVFLEFENADWEAELQDFHGTDVEVPATLIIDGKRYTNVGVHFRGMSSYMGVPWIQAVPQRLARLGRQKTAPLRLQDSEPDELTRRPFVDEYGIVLAHRSRIPAVPEGEFRQSRD